MEQLAKHYHKSPDDISEEELRHRKEVTTEPHSSYELTFVAFLAFRMVTLRKRQDGQTGKAHTRPTQGMGVSNISQTQRKPLVWTKNSLLERTAPWSGGSLAAQAALQPPCVPASALAAGALQRRVWAGQVKNETLYLIRPNAPLPKLETGRGRSRVAHG